MPALTIRYRKIVSLALANNVINFTESAIVGHRVQIPMSVDYLNTFFVWERTSGSPRPIGHFLSEVGSVKFVDVLINSLNKLYTDIDGTANGLNFSSFILDSNYDSRIRCDGISANDIVMAYILYKCYGASSSPTVNLIYNLEDANKMITSSQVASAIVELLNEDEQMALTGGVDKGDVDAMFRYMLSANPLRYFKANGTQIDGLFETNFCYGEADPPGRGSWGFIENDIVELRINFSFPQAVTHSTADDLGGNRTVVIPAGSNFGIRLQILATDTPGGSTSKQAATAAAEAAALGQQQAAAAASAANASIAAAMAEGQRQAAAYRTTIEEESYIRAVNENARQAIASSNAQATATAAFAALQEAIVSGSTQSSIQSLRALAIASAAAAARAAIIATQAATKLQNAENAKAAAEQVLANAETAAADAAAASATANSMTVTAALAKALADAATIAASKTAAEEATNPATKILTDAENKLLDPKTLIALRLTLSDAHSKTLKAWADFTEAKSTASLAEKKLTSATMDLNCAILANKSDGEINILRALIESAMVKKTVAVKSAALATTALILAQSNEKGALDDYTMTSTQVAALANNVAKSALTNATAVLAITSAAVVTATTSNTTAQTDLTEAQEAITAAIAEGASMADVSVLRTAVLTKTVAARTASAALAVATNTNLSAQADVDSLTAASESADEKLITVEDDNTVLIDSYNTSLESLETYEQGIITSVEVAAKAKQLNYAHLRVVNTSQDSNLASAAYDVAKRQYDIALAAQSPDTDLLNKLNASVLEARSKKDSTAAAFALAQDHYTTAYAGVIEDAESKAILAAAMTNFATSITAAKANSMALALYDAIAASNAAENTLETTQTQYTLAQNALNSAITATATIDDIRSLNAALGTARDAYVNATIAYNTAQAAVAVAQQGVTLSENSLAILTDVSLLQNGQAVIVKANALVADITLKYEDAVATQTLLFAAKESYTIASAALIQAVKAGKGIIEIIPLQTNLHNASIKLSNLTFLSAGKNLAVTNALALGTQDSIAKAIIDSSTVVVQAATVVAKINTLNAMLIKLTQDEATAKTAFDIESEKLVVAKLNLDTAITSGNSISDIQSFQAAVQTATNNVVLTQTAYSKATTARIQATADVNTLTEEEEDILTSAEKTPLLDAIDALTAANADMILQSKRTSADIMAASVLSQTTTMRTAQNNLTAATAALVKVQATYDTVKASLDAGIAAGVDLDGIKEFLVSEQKAAVDLSNAQSLVTSATNAYTNAQAAVAASQAAADILAAIALAAGV